MGHTKKAVSQMWPAGHSLLIPGEFNVSQSMFFVMPTGVSWGKGFLLNDFFETYTLIHTGNLKKGNRNKLCMSSVESLLPWNIS